MNLGWFLSAVPSSLLVFSPVVRKGWLHPWLVDALGRAGRVVELVGNWLGLTSCVETSWDILGSIVHRAVHSHMPHWALPIMPCKVVVFFNINCFSDHLGAACQLIIGDLTKKPMSKLRWVDRVENESQSAGNFQGLEAFKDIFLFLSWQIALSC